MLLTLNNHVPTSSLFPSLGPFDYCFSIGQLVDIFRAYNQVKYVVKTLQEPLCCDMLYVIMLGILKYEKP